MNPIDHTDLITVCQAARMVKRTPPTLIRWILHDGLQAVRIKGRYLVSRKALLERMEQAAGGQPVTARQKELQKRMEQLAGEQRGAG